MKTFENNATNSDKNIFNIKSTEALSILDDLERRKRTIATELDRLQREIEAAKYDKQKMADEISLNTNRRNELEAEISSLKKDAESHSKKSLELSTVKDTLEKELSELKNSHALIEQKTNTAKVALKEQDQINSEAISRLESTKKEHEFVLKTRDKLNHEITKTNDSLSVLKSEENKLNAEISKLKKECRDLSEEKDVLKLEIAPINEFKSKNPTYQSILNEIALSESKLISLKQNIADNESLFNNSISSLKKENMALLKTRDSLKSEIEPINEFKSKNPNYRAILEDIKMSEKTLYAQNEQIKNNKSILKEHEVLSSQIGSLKKEIDSLNKELTQSNSALNSRYNEMLAIRQQIFDLIAAHKDKLQTETIKAFARKELNI